MKNNISQFNKCANCGACVNICPTKAININKEKMFYELIVDDLKCIECGKCIAVCPVNNPFKTQKLISAYYGYMDNNSILLGSSSGGIFYAIAQKILKDGGIVFGASFSKDKHSVVFSNTDDTQLYNLQKSKYVESDIGDTFKKIKDNLIKGRSVLFCGTPCQSSGLKRYLGKEYDKLIICDFSCGGLPSHKIYDEYLCDLENRFSSKVEHVDFRPKNYGWDTHSIYIKFKNGKEYTKLATLDTYYRGFLRNLSKRDYCYKCDFSDNHAADIILADFWLYKKLSTMENKNKGISLILTNTKKGDTLMKELSSYLVIEKLSLEKASYNIKNGHQSKTMIERHFEFINLVNKKGVVYAVNKMAPISLRNDWKQMIKQLIKKGKYEGSKKTWN